MSDIPSPEGPTTEAIARRPRILRVLSAAAFAGAGQLARVFSPFRARTDSGGATDGAHAALRDQRDDERETGSLAGDSKELIVADAVEWDHVSVVRLPSGWYLVHASDEENSYRFSTDSEPQAIALAFGFSPSERFSERCEAILAGPFDRALEGWRNVAADWWEEQGEDSVAATLRRAEEWQRHREVMKDMTLEERAAYLRSLPEEEG